jgi:hypothetical protein
MGQLGMGVMLYRLCGGTPEATRTAVVELQ